MKVGACAIVLHSRLPYCRRAGHWPHGEEWLHEAALKLCHQLWERDKVFPSINYRSFAEREDRTTG